jgi:hypothetical protein
VVFVTKERESTQNSKLQQLSSGASPFAYWLSLFLFDCCFAAIPATMGALAFVYFNEAQAGALSNTTTRNERVPQTNTNI